jgi:anti-sigma B factor antagonist
VWPFSLAALVVGIPLAVAGDARLGGGAWATPQDMSLRVAAVLAAALALAFAAHLGWRVVAGGTQRRVDARRYAAAEPGGLSSSSEHRLVQPTRRLGGAVVAPMLASRPAAEAEPVLDRIRSCMDEVSYAPGNPNVLSMTKYLHDVRSGRAGTQHDDPPCAEAEPSSFARRDAGDETLLEIHGVFDAITSADVRPTIEALLAERRKAITVNLSSLRLIDSSGVGVIVGLFKRCASYGGTVKVTGLKDQPLAIFRLLRLDRIFAVD